MGAEDKARGQDRSLLDRQTDLWELEMALALCTLKEAPSLTGSLETGLRAAEALQILMAVCVKPASCALRAGLHCWQLGGVGHQAEGKCQELDSSLHVARHEGNSQSQRERTPRLSA